MSTDAKSKWGPIRFTVAGIGVAGTIAALLANADPAVDGAKRLWARFTSAPAPLETVWQGDWRSREGFHFDFAMQLDVAADDKAEGKISWRLVSAPDDSFLNPREGSIAEEYVRGTYDREKKLAMITGYEVSDPTLIATDTYKLQVKPDGISFIGMTRGNLGEWEAQTSGTVIISEIE